MAGQISDFAISSLIGHLGDLVAQDLDHAHAAGMALGPKADQHTNQHGHNLIPSSREVDK